MNHHTSFPRPPGTPWSRRTFWMALLGLGAGLLLIVGMVDRMLLPLLVQVTPTVVVPDVTGLHETDAIRRLVDLGLVIADVHEQSSVDTPAEHIVQQTPYAGATVKSGRRIYLTVSSGAETVVMPSLIGVSAREAQLTLRRLGLALGLVTSAPNDSIPTDHVVYQSLPVGSSISLGNRIDLVISSGAPYLVMPDVIGFSIEEARAMLAASGISIRSIEVVPSGSLLPNTVMSSIPAPSQPVPGDSSVILRVVSQ